MVLHYGPDARGLIVTALYRAVRAGWCGTRELTTPGDPIRFFIFLVAVEAMKA